MREQHPRQRAAPRDRLLDVFPASSEARRGTVQEPNNVTFSDDAAWTLAKLAR
jgi:hypothetical protein